MAENWNWVWKLEVAPKIRVFIWRCLKEVLPVCINLISRFIDVEPFCKRCGREPETAEHALRDCENASSFWNGSPIREDLPTTVQDDVPLSQWIKLVAGKISNDKQAMFVTLLWYLWWARNKLYFEEKRLDDRFLYAKAIGQVEEYNNANSFTKVHGGNAVIKEKWKPPPQGFIKINTDAAVLMGRNIGVNSVARDADGGVLWCFSEKVDGCMDVDSAKAIAMLRGLQIATTRGSPNIIMEFHSQTLIKALCNPRLNLSLFGSVIDDILEMRPSFGEVCFEWIQKMGNSVAHSLASSAFERVEPFCSSILPNEQVLNVIADNES